MTPRPKFLALVLAFAATLSWPSTADSAEIATRPAGEIWRDCPECPEMVTIPSGRFEMGSSNEEAEREGVNDRFALRERPIHTVTIAQPFALGRYPVTKREFADFVADIDFEIALGCMVISGSGLKWDATKSWRDPGFDQTDRDPVVCIDWTTANFYVAWLKLKTRAAYRLPSESEWEYAARAGTVTTRPWDDAVATVCEFGNVNDQTSVDANRFWWTSHACEDGWASTAPVGTYRPNAFGLFDMLGNVWEWLEDCWHRGYEGAPGDGSAWIANSECRRRVIRGASWIDGPEAVRSASRLRYAPDYRDSYTGFRVARAIDE